MKEYTAVRNHSVAHVAVRSPKMLGAWKNKKECTVVRNHSVAHTVVISSSVEEHEIMHSGGKFDNERSLEEHERIQW